MGRAFISASRSLVLAACLSMALVGAPGAAGAQVPVPKSEPTPPVDVSQLTAQERADLLSRLSDEQVRDLMLAYLKDHYKLVVLSNVDNVSFAHSEEKLGKPFHLVYTAEDVGSYKPSHRNFEYMLANLERLGIAKHEILHTAESMFHDHAPANALGLANCWIYRRHGKKGFGATMRPDEMPRYDRVFNSMAELVDAHKAECRS